ncbi:MAG: hypothetical protein KDJ75_08885 [Alphaproteobacteria bacterium]|nr:hypothetical protein [Alphaproteobacteria bacterium]
MMGTRGVVQTASRIGEIKGEISALMSALSHLAPHPDRPDESGLVFIRSTSGIRAPADYEGMLGSVLLEGVLSGAFDGSSGDGADVSGTANTYPDTGMLMDAAGEYLKDRAEEPYGHARGRGSFAACPHKTSCNSFEGLDARRQALMEAFMADLPERMVIEGRIAADERDLSILKYKEVHQGPAYDA